MRDKKVRTGINGRKRRQARAADPKLFGAKPTRRAGQLVGGRYRLLGQLGNGGTASVYLACDSKTGHGVVVKQLAEQNEHNEALRQRFLAEAEALSKIQHAGIVRVLDFGAKDDQRPYLVMETLVGETLSSLLKRRNRLPTELALRIARDTARGLVAVHQAGLVHRDIKPDNLFLLGPHGDPFGVKIIDFGMAKLPETSDSSGGHTVLGTIEYMAPEQVLADPVDARADIYGFGIVLFRLFTGHLPFEAPEGLDLLSHQLFSLVPPPSWIHPGVDEGLDAIVQRATRKHPDNRYPAMEPLIRDLETASTCSSPLVVDPDVYAPRSDQGREVAELLRERYLTIAPAFEGKTQQEAAVALIRFQSSAPPPDDPAEFDELAEDDLELCEG